MKYEDVKDYIQLQAMFQARCEEVCGLLTPLNDSYRHLETFEIIDNEVYGEGDEYYASGAPTSYCSQKFPLNFLWEDDEEIKQYVEDELKKRKEAKEAERLRFKKVRKEFQEILDRKEYERLKAKFEGV